MEEYKEIKLSDWIKNIDEKLERDNTPIITYILLSLKEYIITSVKKYNYAYDIFGNKVIKDKEHIETWSEKAYSFLQQYIKTHNKAFMAEQVREASRGTVPMPDSDRSWGGIIKKAANNSLIERIGYDLVSNPLANRTPAAVWKRI